MIISDIRTHLLSVPFTDPPKTGFLTLGNIDLLVVEVETASGVVGTGHLHPLAGGMRTLEMCVHEMLKPLLIGRDARDVEALWQRMWQATFIQGRMGITVMAMSALDIALWDAVGRSEGKPLWQLWGGRPDPLPIYGSGCFRGLGHDGMIEKAERFVAEGFTAIKMQVAHLFTHDEDVANVRDMRAALGDRIEIWSTSTRAGRRTRRSPLAVGWTTMALPGWRSRSWPTISTATTRLPMRSVRPSWAARIISPITTSSLFSRAARSPFCNRT